MKYNFTTRPGTVERIFEINRVNGLNHDGNIPVFKKIERPEDKKKKLG